MSSTGQQIAGLVKEDIMQGYAARKGDRYYAVIYEGIDPLTGRERRRWHPALPLSSPLSRRCLTNICTCM